MSYNELDHICYRVETLAEYTENKEYLSKIWWLLSETEIWWRLISTYKLHDPIRYQNRKIALIELPSPKQWSNYKTWFEHVEFVIKEGFENFMWKYKDLSFKTDALRKGINPDVSLSFWSLAVKFHKNTLEHVIEFEQS